MIDRKAAQELDFNEAPGYCRVGFAPADSLELTLKKTIAGQWPC